MQLLGGLGAGLTIIALLIAWQLHQGPVSLSFLTPHVEKALNSGHRTFALAFEDTTLTWAGWDNSVVLRVKNVRAVGEEGAAVARIPELSLALSGKALLRGELAPRFIELLGPELKVRREPHGGLDFQIVTNTDGDVGEKVASGLLGWLLKAPQPGSPMSYLETVRISGATMTYDDRVTGKSLQAPVGHLRLDRAPFGLTAAGSVLIDVDGRVADITVSGGYHRKDGRLDVTATFADIAPASFSTIYEKLEDLSAIDVPLTGNVVLGMTIAGGVETVGFNVTGGAGSVALPAPFDKKVDVVDVNVRGLFSASAEKLIIDAAAFRFADDTSIELPAPIDHAYTIRSISGNGFFDGLLGTAELNDLNIDLGGPTVTSSAKLRLGKANQSTNVVAQGELRNVPVNDVKQYWPASLGSDAYVWVTRNLSEGILNSATAQLDVNLDPDGALEINSLDGTMNVEGVTVDFMPGLPPATGVAGLISFDKDTFDIAIERGNDGNVNVAGGTVHISGLQEIDQYADIDLHLEAPISDALALIDHEPLGFASAMNINTEGAKGDSKIDLNLRLLLAKDLTLDQIEVSAKAALTGVEMDKIVLHRGIEDGDLKLEVDKVGMDVSGFVRMGPIPANLAWRENFQDDAPFRSSFVVDASIADVDDIRHLGIHATPLDHDYISGGADARVRYTIFDDRRVRVDVFADIARAELRVPLLDWRKPRDSSGRASVTILLENGLVKNVPSFQVAAGDLSVKGDIVYSDGGLGLERINFEEIILGRSNVAGAIISRPDGGWELGLHGDTLDATPLWDRVIHDRPGDPEVQLPNLTVAVEFDKLWIDRGRFLSDVSGTFVHRQDIWRTVLLDSKINGEESFNINITPGESGNREMLIRAENAGDSLRFLDLFDNMHGGVLEIRGRYDDAAIGNPLRGKLRVVNYRVRNAPLLARILSIMALTGILDAMTGEGLNFNELDVPFTYREGELQIADAKATGTSLGFTASGTVYTHADVINLEGTVVPAYAINSLLGNIPLLGDLLTGTEEGGGVFAANFAVSGPIEDPLTSVNPLAALTPGIFRNLFGALEPDENPPSILGDDPGTTTDQQ